mgnify:CR=1 FL=1
MKLLRLKDDKLVVVIYEPEGVTNDDIGETLANSPAWCSLIDEIGLVDSEGILPLGAPSGFGDDVSHATLILMPAPSVMWYQKHPEYWGWGTEE